jgi:hypothetical protein
VNRDFFMAKAPPRATLAGKLSLGLD